MTRYQALFYISQCLCPRLLNFSSRRRSAYQQLYLQCQAFDNLSAFSLQILIDWSKQSPKTHLQPPKKRTSKLKLTLYILNEFLSKFCPSKIPPKFSYFTRRKKILQVSDKKFSLMFINF